MGTLCGARGGLLAAIKFAQPLFPVSALSPFSLPARASERERIKLQNFHSALCGLLRINFPWFSQPKCGLIGLKMRTEDGIIIKCTMREPLPRAKFSSRRRPGSMCVIGEGACRYRPAEQSEISNMCIIMSNYDHLLHFIIPSNAVFLLILYRRSR